MVVVVVVEGACIRDPVTTSLKTCLRTLPHFFSIRFSLIHFGLPRDGTTHPPGHCQTICLLYSARARAPPCLKPPVRPPWLHAFPIKILTNVFITAHPGNRFGFFY